ncbi:PilZ domain-containing protein [Mariprofundus sp. KV]|uniref:PilZ domain-containing protein n=1 Tax=Mariprofundus sp. KV TaxID=2608715 RepID=UPI0015A3F75B|nr:PilZ domain-containing protein [Mariprofundus sp. KV]NWF37458.1 PilZ domain-containing protein [Mariprofundus sp. KV]
MPNSNHRRYTRSQVEVAALLTIEHQEPVEVEVLDVSMNGTFLKTNLKLEAGTRCTVSILLGHFQHELPIEAEAVVVRATAMGLALRFESVKIDSTPRLQTLIVDHAEDPKQVQLEFSQQGGFIFNPDRQQR